MLCDSGKRGAKGISNDDGIGWSKDGIADNDYDM